ncbi:hypothetical protein V3C99_017983 [Haemonchus contortus]|uniref:BBE domain-containing protein n=1 Tax=Haemonchus contortus TaxID=6289 RepID=A0A7I4Z3W4_HAECO
MNCNSPQNNGLSSIFPQILRSCADLFSLLNHDVYLVAGYNSDPSTTIKKDVKKMTMQTLKNVEPETRAQSWEDFYTFESSKVGEFGGSETVERRRTDHAVWNAFEKTIERKEDGYYVRSHWKKDS